MREDLQKNNRTDALMRLMDRLMHRRPSPPRRLVALTPLDIRTIGALGELEPCTMSALSAGTGLLVSGLTRVLDRLVSQSIAARNHAPYDRRCVLVSLTPAGTRLYRDLRRWRRALAARMLCRLNLKEQTQLLGLFERMTTETCGFPATAAPRRTGGR
ncbi:MAG: MarR family winged helix-turn-helix transcriptional regulator [bacterium]